MPEPLVLLAFAVAWVGHAYVLGLDPEQPLRVGCRSRSSRPGGSSPQSSFSRSRCCGSPETASRRGVGCGRASSSGRSSSPSSRSYRLLRKTARVRRVGDDPHARPVGRTRRRSCIGDGQLSRGRRRLPGNGVFRVDFTDLTLALAEPAAGVGRAHASCVAERPALPRHAEPAVLRPRAWTSCVAGPRRTSCASPATSSTPTRTTNGSARCSAGCTATGGEVRDPRQPRPAPRTGARPRGTRRRRLHGARQRLEAMRRSAACRASSSGTRGRGSRRRRTCRPRPPDLFRLCLSHTPDNFYWGIGEPASDLMLCGHVHGGAIRVPRDRVDLRAERVRPAVRPGRVREGRHGDGGEPRAEREGAVRFRCNPQVIRITLTRRPR